MNISASIRKLTLIFVALFIALSAGLVYWQVVVAQQVTSNPHNSRVYLNSNIAVRGKIFDRNGVLLADWVPDGTGGYMRHYSDPSLAGLIGYYVPGFLPTGIEAKYDDYLSGRRGLTALDNTINKTLHRPPVGDDIYLTIDERIQKIADRDFDTPIPSDPGNVFPTNRGSAIITDPHTGEILAMVSRPYYDPNQMVQTLSRHDLSYYNQESADKDRPLIEKPIQEFYPPGSTYKTMTLIAGLDSRSTSLTDKFDEKQARGPIFYNGEKFGPIGNNIEWYTGGFPVTTDFGFSHSDNIIFAQIGVKTGQATWLDYNKRFYVGQQIPFDLPVLPSQVLKNGQPLTDNQLAADAFGQGADVMTPMQMSLIDNAVANDGNLMRPTLVQKVTDPNKTQIDKFDPQSLGQPMSGDTANQVRQAMYGVARCGSGSIVRPWVASPWGIIGKTGTAQLSNDLTVPADAWLITQAPYSITNPSQKPLLTIVGMRENGGEGGADNGPMIAAMYNDIFTTVMKTTAPPPPSSAYCYSTGLL